MLQCPPKYLRTMVVDDSPAFRRILCSYFDQHCSIEVVGAANNADEAFAAIPFLHPDLVLMDLQMPGTNGLEATAEVRRQFPEIVVIVITAHDVPGLKEVCKEKGAADFVCKSNLNTELPAVLARLRPCQN